MKRWRSSEIPLKFTISIRPSHPHRFHVLMSAPDFPWIGHNLSVEDLTCAFHILNSLGAAITDDISASSSESYPESFRQLARPFLETHSLLKDQVRWLGKQVHELQSELENLRTAHETAREEIRMLREMRRADLREQRRFKAELAAAARELIDVRERLVNEQRLPEFNY
jgi:predicted RNase H-like nuclease (RuvC/YqgF family)